MTDLAKLHIMKEKSVFTKTSYQIGVEMKKKIAEQRALLGKGVSKYDVALQQLGRHKRTESQDSVVNKTDSM